jgi:uncharacterized protein (TIGR02145 family)
LRKILLMKPLLNTCLILFIAILTGCSKSADKASPTQPVAPTFGDFALPAKEFVDKPFTIIAPKSTSDGAITYTSSNKKVATISGQTITITGTGLSVITAKQAATKSFTADSVKANFTVGLAAPTLTAFTIPNKKETDVPFLPIYPKSNSTGAFTFKSYNSNVAIIGTDSKIILKGPGTCTILAIQAATANFRADSVQATFTVTGLPKPTITGFTVPEKKLGDAAFALVKPISNSTGAFTYKSSNTAVATISGSTVTIKGAGYSYITALQAASATYKADSVQETFIVLAKATVPTLSNFTVPGKYIGEAPFTLIKPNSNSAGAFTYTSSNTAIATVSGNTVTIKAKGQTTITVTQAASGNYAVGSTSAVLTVTDRPATGTVTDVDGNVYATIKIGTQTWMIENLKVTHYSDGTPVPNVTDDNTWKGLLTGAYCNYNNDVAMGKIYGKLYNWYAVTNPHLLAPAGWHIPTDAEWNTLYNYIGGTRESGQKIQEQGTTHWTANTGATNSTLFTGLPGGTRDFEPFYGVFTSIGSDGMWWSTTPAGTTNAVYMDLYVKGYFERHEDRKYYGYSVRCIKN